jgi:hypothetical protein
MGHEYQVKIRLPEDYANTTKLYPVLYLLDGDHAFAMATDIVQYLIYGQHIPDLIIASPAYDSKKLPHEGGKNRRVSDLAPFRLTKRTHRLQEFNILNSFSRNSFPMWNPIIVFCPVIERFGAIPAAAFSLYILYFIKPTSFSATSLLMDLMSGTWKSKRRLPLNTQTCLSSYLSQLHQTIWEANGFSTS